MTDLVERLEEVGCDREPFTSAHAKCICRLTNEAAKEIDRLRKLLAETQHDFAVQKKNCQCCRDALGEARDLIKKTLEG